ncbi:LysR substrate-binding domain-containing protein, partial [Sutterella wadsworthensis]|uniref:LysR substrate-binding domain-containing protein n=1 Tax=Sutterella wadsworthensis TaxID=40545 RepID=UPI00258E8C4A
KNRSYVGPDELKDQTMLLLGTGHCFRDQILGICPTMARFQASASTVQRTVEGSSLQTICHMVAQGLGITVLPSSAVPYLAGLSNTVKIIPFKNPTPTRRVVLVWRKSFTRMAAVDALREQMKKLRLNGCVPLNEPALLR